MITVFAYPSSADHDADRNGVELRDARDPNELANIISGREDKQTYLD